MEEPWGRPGRAGCGPGDVLGGPGAVLESYKRHRGGYLGRLGAVLGALEAMSEPSRGQKAPKIEPKRIPNRAPEATPGENDETLIFNDSTKDFNNFSSLRASFSGPKWVPNRIIDAEGVRNSLGSLLERSWSSSEPQKHCWERLLRGQEALHDRFTEQGAC